MAEPLANRLEVGQHLARVEVVGERVDHRNGRCSGHGLDPALREGPEHQPVAYPQTTLVVSSMVSSRPICEVRPSTITGWPPS